MSHCIHALDERLIVAALCIEGRGLRLVCPDCTPCDQTNPGANRRTLIAPKRRARHRTNSAAHHRSARSSFVCGLHARLTTNAGKSVILAASLIRTELLDALAGPRQGHDAWSGWDGCASGQTERDQHCKTLQHWGHSFHRWGLLAGGCAGTLRQPPGH